MPSQRIQRRIDGLLDQAEQAADAGQWQEVRGHAARVQAIDPDNADAAALLVMADAIPFTADPSSTPDRRAPTLGAAAYSESFVDGRYRVERFLGDGGRKRVFLAHDTTLDRDVAFALLRAEGLDTVGRQQLLHEARAMARIGAHPNMVAIHDIGEENDSPFLVEEFMPGGDVAALLADGPPRLDRVLAITAGVCEGLAFIHGQQLIHRDLKPSNIFLAEDGTAKVGDFGLAVSLNRTRITAEGTLVGTVAYMPPEQALGGAITPQSDLYALGAMMYELVTGRPPFAGDDPTSVISQHINTPPVAPSWHSEHCPPALEELILQLLEKDPARRPDSARAVKEVLAAIDPEERSARHSGSGESPLEGLARGVFVGREPELELLRKAFDEAFAGHGRVVMVVGEPGIGKTRTTQELETYARMRGARVLWGRAHEASGAPAFWPWIQVGNSHARFVPPAELTSELDPSRVNELGRIFPALQTTAPDPSEEPETARFRLFDAYVAFMRAGSERAPLVIVLDDLQWSDAPSLQLLQHFARELSRMRILVIGTYRDTDLTRSHPLSGTLGELSRQGGLQRVVLRGLSKPEVASYIRSIANADPPTGLVTRIYDETEGNPFFVSEVVNLMVQEGGLAAAAASEIAIPDGVREAIGRRLNLLSERANELLTVAAVVGREFPFETLSLLHDGSDDELVALIDEGLSARVMVELDQPGRYQFSHAQMQEALLSEISTTSRVHLNARIAEALERRYGDQADARASRLAQHFFEAATISDRHAQKAVRYSMLAARAAEDQSGWGEAARHYEHCVTLARSSFTKLDLDLADLLAALGKCLVQAGSYREAWRALMSAIDLYRERADGEGIAQALLSMRGLPLSPARFGPLADEALALLGDENEHLRAVLLLRIWEGAGIDTRLNEARRLIEANAFDDLRPVLLWNEASRAQIAADFALALSQQQEAIEQLTAQRRTFDMIARLSGLLAMLAFLGRLGDVERLAREGRVAADQLQAAFPQGQMRGHLASTQLLRADFAGFDNTLEDAHFDDYSLDLLRSLRAEMSGDREAAAAAIPGPDRAGGVAPFELHLHGGRARALLRSGQREAAEVSFAKWADLWTEYNFDGQAIDGVGTVLQRAASLSDASVCFSELASPELIAEVYTEVAAWSGAHVCPWTAVALDGVRGRIALLLDLNAEAEAHFEQGLAWCERERCPIEAGRSHQGLAEVALRRGDQAAARAHVDAAAKLFEEFGAKLYLDEVIALKFDIQGASSTGVQTSIDALAASLAEQRPALTVPAAPDGTVTVLFSDIAGSTALNVALGDDGWMRVLAEHNRLIRTALDEHRGYEVKTEGDAFMVAFQSARDAVRCAITVQRAFQTRNAVADTSPLRVRIGLHTGEPVRAGTAGRADFYGTHVVMASRVAGLARGGEVLVSSLLHDLVAGSGEFTLEAQPAVVLKGLTGEHVTYAVQWGAREGDVLPPPEGDRRARSGGRLGHASPLAGLTQRETDVLTALARGFNNKEIASRLGLSVRTVERHITSLYGKIDARGRADATVFALSNGLGGAAAEPVPLPDTDLGSA